MDVERKHWKYLELCVTVMSNKNGSKLILTILSIKHNSETSLLRLPAEIRNLIWEYALGGRTIRCFALSFPTPTSRIAKGANNALLRVCRQIYAETALSPYRMNTFSFDSFWSTQQWLRTESKALPVQRQAIKTVRIKAVVDVSRQSHLSNETALEDIVKQLPHEADIHIHIWLGRETYDDCPTREWIDGELHPISEESLRQYFHGKLRSTRHRIRKMATKCNEGVTITFTFNFHF